LFEYMASGTPIIASDIPSVREVLDETTAYFFEANNPEALSSAVKKIFNGYDAAQERAKHAAEHVRRFSWDARAAAIQKHILWYNDR
ncbi:glycosyltransferase, partial [bacterium]|nr:glycosyltransferase [bacterium]